MKQNVYVTETQYVVEDLIFQTKTSINVNKDVQTLVSKSTISTDYTKDIKETVQKSRSSKNITKSEYKVKSIDSDLKDNNTGLEDMKINKKSDAQQKEPTYTVIKKYSKDKEDEDKKEIDAETDLIGLE